MKKLTPKHIESDMKTIYRRNCKNKNKKITQIGSTRAPKTGPKSIPTWYQNAYDFLSLQVAQTSHARVLGNPRESSSKVSQGVLSLKDNQFTDPTGDSGTSRALGHSTIVPEARWRIIISIINIVVILLLIIIIFIIHMFFFLYS